MLNAAKWLAVMALLLGIFLPAPRFLQQGRAYAAVQNATLTLESPPACPASGCAPGQRLNFVFTFDLKTYSPAPAANVQACVYAPLGWVDKDHGVTITPKGRITGAAYSPVSACAGNTAPPDGYELVAASEAAINQSVFGDDLGIALRLSPGAAAPGTLYARVLERSASGWQVTQDDFIPTLPVTPLPSGATITAYVAETPQGCAAGNYSPCYVNSGDDLPEGYGTGLKDAVDIVPDGSSITIAGIYPIKSNIVDIQRPVILSGAPGAKITYTGNKCAEAMLSVRSGVTVRDLEMNDGTGCVAGASSQNRTLIDINSAQPVRIEANRLVDGDQAIQIADNSGPVTVLYNHIENNGGFGIYWENGLSQASLDVIGNNIIPGSNGSAINCGSSLTSPAPNRKANYNYWGGGQAPTQSASRCTITSGRELGAPIAPRTGMPGVQVERVTVDGEKRYAFNDRFGFQIDGGSSFGLYIVNHGFTDPKSIPFTSSDQTDMKACSSYWNVFSAEDAAPGGTLNLYVKYDRTTDCTAAINSSRFCGQTSDRRIYPLWWYYPVTGIWNRTGQILNAANAVYNGQETQCSINDKEIQVSIDSSGRPNLENDLLNLPLVVGVEVLQTYRLMSSSSIVWLDWTTRNEPDIDGFFVERSEDNKVYSTISEKINRAGSAVGGAGYRYQDPNRVTGALYYYRLRMTRSDGGFPIYSEVKSAIGVAATATNTPNTTNPVYYTPTPGPSPTFTIPPPTRTSTPTRVLTQMPTRIPSRTPTLPPPTATRPVLTLQGDTGGLPFPTDGTASPGVGDPYPPPVESTSPTDGAGPVEESTPQPTASSTPAVTQVSWQQEEEEDLSTFTILRSLLLGFSSGLAALGTAAVWFFFMRRRDGL